jgi:uncharacterized protein
MNFKEKYGPCALIAGGSEGLGAAWAKALAKNGLDVVLLARKQEPLEKFALELAAEFGIKATPIACNLADDNVLQQVLSIIGDREIGFVVYNAGLSIIAPFVEKSAEQQVQLARVNMITPLKFAHHFGKEMIARGRGGVVLMSSLAGFQGSGMIATYAATKAFNRVLAEGLWYEWKDKGVDVIGCCAGATATPNYINTKPASTGFFAPQVQPPEAVISECLKRIGKTPSFISGTGNRIASFFMQKLFSRKMAVTIMGDTTKKMYG